MRKLLSSVLLASLLLAGIASAAQAQTVTVGAVLPGTVGIPGGCGTESCTTAIVAAASPATVTVAPFSGTVTTWRIEGATHMPGYGIEVLRKNSDGTFTVTGESVRVEPAASGVEAFPSAIPILAGEYIAASLPAEGTISLLDGSSTETFFEPSLTVGETGPPEGEFPQTFVVGWNADITAPEPAPVIPTPAPVTPTPTCTVPNVKGTKVAAAKKKITAASCKVGKVTMKKGPKAKKGKVIGQGTKAGKVVPAGTAVKLTVGKG